MYAIFYTNDNPDLESNKETYETDTYSEVYRKFHVFDGVYFDDFSEDDESSCEPLNKKIKLD